MIPLIEQQSYNPYFLYCNICPKVKDQDLISIENYIKLKDPQRHKSRLLELLEEEKKTSKINE